MFHDRHSLAPRSTRSVSKKLLMNDVQPSCADRRKSAGKIVNALRDRAQAMRAVINGVHRGHDGEKHLRGADVTGGFVAADVLFARLQREPVRGPASASCETPTSRPGIWRLYSSRVAKKAACGPPKPSGTPKRWALPTATSAPNSPGGLSSVSASRSAATTTSAPASCALGRKPHNRELRRPLPDIGPARRNTCRRI